MQLIFSRQLKLYPKLKFESKEYFSVYLILADFGDNDTSKGKIVKAHFQISILNKNGQPVRQVGE